MALATLRRWWIGRPASRARRRQRLVSPRVRELEARLTPSLVTLASFNATDGKWPVGGVVLDGRGNLFGTTEGGGAFVGGGGTLFEVGHGSGQITELAQFGGGGGFHPVGGLISDGSGNLYGTAEKGGASNDGTVFEWANSRLTALASFNGTNGKGPLAGLVMDSSGNLYGTTSAGGASNDGTVFEIAHGFGTIITLGSFDGTNGAMPEGGLVIDGSGNLYGTARGGGAAGDGTIFKVVPGSGTITALASFNGSDGASPAAGLVMDGGGNLYGATAAGGVSGDGTVFELAQASHNITTLATFNHTTGANATSNLLMDSIGDLYGTTDRAVFELAKGSRTITTLAVFDGPDGRYPSGLGVDSSGNLYGVAMKGGANNVGTVFELPGGAIPTDQWTGANFAVDTNWSDGANWSLGAPPTAAQAALFTKNSTVKDFTATVDAGFTNAIADLRIDSTWGGTITVNSALSVTVTFTLGSGSLGGKGAVTIAGDYMQWTGGQIVVGVGGFTNTGSLTVDTTGGNLVLTGEGTLTNDGTINEAGTNTLLLEDTATLSNASGATFDLIDNGNVGQSGGGTFASAGTLEKTGGAATSTISSAVINSGAITVQTGILALAGGGGTSTGGTFNVWSNATLDLTGGANVAYEGTYSGTGLGTVALRAGTLQVGVGGATFNMPGTLLQWTGGAIDVTSGTFTNTGIVNYSGSGRVVLTGAGSLVNDGRIIQTSGAKLFLEDGATLDNAAGATYDIESDGGLAESGGGTFTNAGTLEKTKGLGTSTIATSTLDNPGIVTVTRGTLDISATVTQVARGTLKAGHWRVTGSSKAAATLDITSAGGLTTLGAGATVTLGPNATFSSLSGLATIDNGATLSLLDGQSFTDTAALTNNGALTLSPQSILTVGGSFTQTSTGTLTIELGGTFGAPTFGQLFSTSGTVALAGSLDVTSSVVPAVGNSLTILENEGNSAISSDFAGLPEAGTFTVTVGRKTMNFQITYIGPGTFGDNNVIITRIS
jgi:uncharacterized repeat protein (TIGR03803 family)